MDYYITANTNRNGISAPAGEFPGRACHQQCASMEELSKEHLASPGKGGAGELAIQTRNEVQSTYSLRLELGVRVLKWGPGSS